MTSAIGAERRSRLPDLPLALAYVGFAHLALIVVCAILAARPTTLTGFYYHPRAVAVAHLVTLGWISSSILGALYLIAPMALGARLPRRPIDVVAAAGWAIGVSGMVSHFWLESPEGMLWSAGLVLTSAAVVAIRCAIALRRSSLPSEVRLHFELAFINLGAAAVLGMSVGFSRLHPILPTDLLHGTLAHAHLAAVGWATMTVFGAAYRLLPMLLPSAMPSGGRVRATAWILEAGALGFAAALLYRPRWVIIPAAACLVAAGIFYSNVRWMLAHRRPAATNIPRPDYGVWQVHAALLCLPLAIGLGFLLLASPSAQAGSTGMAKTYAALALLGFLAQLVIGMESRLLPWGAWLWGSARGVVRPGPGGIESPYAMVSRPLQVAVLGGWQVGLALLLGGLAFDRAGLLRWGAVVIGLAMVGNAAQVLRLARFALRGTDEPRDLDRAAEEG